MPQIIKCIICEKEFDVIPSRVGKAKYCSKPCAAEAVKFPLVIGEKFNRLTILREIEPEVQYSHDRVQKIRRVECLCECGNITQTRLIMVRNGDCKSCGCLTREQAIINTDQTTHGLSKHPLYIVWNSMKERCYDVTVDSYKNYGGRGIIICERWLYNFSNFYDDMIEGYRKGLKIERVNNDGNYEPSNCIWATGKTQAGNRRNSIRVTINGETMCLTAACEQLGIKYFPMRKRIKVKKMSFEDALKDYKIKNNV